MEFELTPLEEAVLNAQDFAAGMAVSTMVQELIERSDALQKTVNDPLALDHRERAEAIKERRHINLQLEIVAAAQAVAGVTA